MATLLEMTAEIVKAHASRSKMTSEEILRDLKMVYAALQGLGSAQPVGFEEKAHAALTVKQAFKKDEVICMVCGQAGMKTLTRHLKSSHDLEPNVYRQQFGIPYNQSLSSRDFTEDQKGDGTGARFSRLPRQGKAGESGEHASQKCVVCHRWVTVGLIIILEGRRGDISVEMHPFLRGKSCP